MKVDRDEALRLYDELQSAVAVSRRLGCHENTIKAIVSKLRLKCVRCKNRPAPGKTMCMECLIKDRERMKQARAERRHRGVCIECGGVRMLGNNRYCEHHRGKVMERQSKYQARKNADRLAGASRGGTSTRDQKHRFLMSRYGQAAVDRWEHAGGKCEACGAAHGEVAIHMHHRDEDQSNNTFENFACLCFFCHRAVHLLLNSRDRAGLLLWFSTAYAIEPPPAPKP